MKHARQLDVGGDSLEFQVGHDFNLVDPLMSLHFQLILDS
jgi:hypothetical protein